MIWNKKFCGVNSKLNILTQQSAWWVNCSNFWQRFITDHDSGRACPATCPASLNHTPWRTVPIFPECRVQRQETFLIHNTCLPIQDVMSKTTWVPCGRLWEVVLLAGSTLYPLLATSLSIPITRALHARVIIQSHIKRQVKVQTHIQRRIQTQIPMTLSFIITSPVPVMQPRWSGVISKYCRLRKFIEVINDHDVNKWGPHCGW